MAIIFDKPPSIIHPIKFSENYHNEYLIGADGKIYKKEHFLNAMLPGMFGTIGFIGGRFVGYYTYTSGGANQNLLTKAGSPTIQGDFHFTINSGITLSGGSSTTAALSTGAFPTNSKIYLTNNGYIYGRGGAGGAGGSTVAGYAGGIGYDALSLGFDLTVTNASGYIFGGGGGGGGGGGYDDRPVYVYGGGGGGGGRGDDGGAGGAAGNGGFQGTTAGTAGTSSSQGSGGTTGQPTLSGGGGDGGTWGAAGTTGDKGSGGSGFLTNGGAGGAAGKAVDKNGHTLTWISGNDSTHVKGAQT